MPFIRYLTRGVGGGILKSYLAYSVYQIWGIWSWKALESLAYSVCWGETVFPCGNHF